MLKKSMSEVRSTLFSDGKYGMIGHTDGFILCQPDPFKIYAVRRLPRSGIRLAAHRGVSNYVAIVGAGDGIESPSDMAVKIWDDVLKKVVVEVQFHNSVRAIFLSHDHLTVLTGHRVHVYSWPYHGVPHKMDRVVLLTDVDTVFQVYQPTMPGNPAALLLYTSENNKNTIRLYNVESKQDRILTEPHKSAILNATMSEQRHRFIIATSSLKKRNRVRLTAVDSVTFRVQSFCSYALSFTKDISNMSFSQPRASYLCLALDDTHELVVLAASVSAHSSMLTRVTTLSMPQCLFTSRTSPKVKNKTEIMAIERDTHLLLYAFPGQTRTFALLCYSIPLIRPTSAYSIEMNVRYIVYYNDADVRHRHNFLFSCAGVGAG
jgi:hypothetical protein